MRIILVSPSLPENVGMVARAMRAFGYADLVLAGGVAPSHPQARAAAAGAEHVLDSARQVPDLASALEGVNLAIGTTARTYERPDLQVIPVRDAAALTARHEGAAWVFGTERHGLPAADLHRCHQVARIPAPGPSLNLAQAAAICLYESRVAVPGAAGTEAGPTRSVANLASLLSRDRLIAWLQELGVARERDAASKVHTLLRLASRLELDEHEAALLAAIGSRLADLPPMKNGTALRPPQKPHS